MDAKTRWANAFIYALVTTIMVLSTAWLISIYANRQANELAQRVDRNVQVTRQANDAIICILGLGTGPGPLDRTDRAINRCIERHGYEFTP
jgi:hypothetical protein